MRVALAQINPTVGDIDGNTTRILQYLSRALDERADLVVFPELAVFGYPPKDLVLRPDLVSRNVDAVQRIATASTQITTLVGFVQPDSSGKGTGVFNAAALCRLGKIESWYAKMLLPTYDVFDEARYFNKGQETMVFDISSRDSTIRAGVTICEDLWNNQQFEGRQFYGVDPVELTARAGASLFVNLSASPYRAGVEPRREHLFAAQLREHKAALLYVNQVGGNDDLVFDGASMVMDARGQVVARAKAFEEDLLLVDLANVGLAAVSAKPSTQGSLLVNQVAPQPDFLEGLRRALVLGTRDYVHKCGFQDVVLGLSGGIDSALTAAIAVDALGAQHVHGVAMPSRFSSPESLADARTLAENLGIDFREIPIETAHRAMEEVLRETFAGREPDVTEENIQSRIRGQILMALSNKFGWMLLTTGNKSELAVGYCTLYGDMCGGLAVLSDVPKTTVYELSRRINEQTRRELIPRRTIERAPTAELRPNQLDQDSLPPYAILDAILEQYIERDRPIAEIIGMGFDGEMVKRVAAMVRCSEHKRKQAPPGLKVTSRAFGTGRRFPIAARYQ